MIKFISVSRNLGAGMVGTVTLAVDAIAMISDDTYAHNRCQITLHNGESLTALCSQSEVMAQINSKGAEA
jgi:hypothetical protein